MLRQIKLLTGIQLVNLFGFNEVRHTGDRKKKGRFLLMTLVWLLLIVMMEGYVVLFSSGLAKLGLGSIVPGYLFVTASLLILVVSFFRASATIFQMKTYEMLIALPVSESAVVVSRFLTMYVTSLMLGALVLVPGFVVCGYSMRPPLYFYICGFLGALLLPFLPLTIATAVGAVITAISARMRHKSLVASFLMIMVTLAAMGGSMALSGMGASGETGQMMNLAAGIETQLERLYPPVVWFGHGVLEGRFGEIGLFFALSFLTFAGMVLVLKQYFLEICRALSAAPARNDYRMGKLKKSSLMRTLLKKEWKRYLASTIYLCNTIIGYLLMAAAAVGTFAVGQEKMEELIGIPGVIEQAFPLLLGILAVIMPITACSVSLEGGQWWILQSLPVRKRDIWNGKLLLNLAVAAPFYLIAVVFSLLALRPGLWSALWLVLIPLLYILFGAVEGLAANLLFPVFQWENEARVVKQSASAMAAMTVGMVSAAIPLVICLTAGEAVGRLVCPITAVVLTVLTAVLYLGIITGRIASGTVGETSR